MTKAFKKGFAAVLSVMMVLCFMPSMAFAASDAQTPSWKDNYSKVTAPATDGTTHDFSTEKSFNPQTGMTEVTPKTIKSTVNGENDIVPADGVKAYYYDFTGSSLVYGGENKALTGTWTYDKFKEDFGFEDEAEGKVSTANVKIQLKGMVDKKETAYVGTAFHDWDLQIVASDYDVNKSNEAQEITFEVKDNGVKTGDVIDASESHPDKIGVVATAKITVKAKPAETIEQKLANASFYLDSVNEKNKVREGVLAGYYDGEEHAVVADTISGAEASYEVYNQKTGKYEAAKEVKLTNADETIKVKAKYNYTDSKGQKASTDAKYFEVKLAKAKVKYAFDTEKANVKENRAIYAVTGSEYNAADYIVCIAEGDEDAKAAAEKAIAANADQLKAYFDEIYKFSDNKDRFHTEEVVVNAKVDKKIQSEIAKKYEALLKNFDLTTRNLSATVRLNQKPVVYVFVDEATVSEGTEPTLNFTVKKAEVKDDTTVFVTVKDFDKSLIKFTSNGGKELKQLKAGEYTLDATADEYTVVVKESKLIVKAKATKPATKPVAKQTQNMTVETKDVKVKAKKKTKKNKTVAPIVKVSGNKGKLSYKKVSGNSKFTVNAKTGKVTVKKGTKKGNYKVKIKVSAAATKAYKATSMTVTVKIKVGK